ncbi:unnamed protein product [Closterium sp. Naga37s-1]|nr:unnamed protein product [Closterium sp. Naga37s-1]
MPRQSQSKSKRVTLRQKYKVIRKVKEHAKKKLKEAKKARRDGVAPRRRVEKDPGIPNDWPFREEELAALEARRQRGLEEREAKKAEKKERARRRRAGLPEEGPLPGAEGVEDEEDAEMGAEGEEGEECGRVTSGAAMAGMVKGAMERGAEFEKRKREREEAAEGQAGKGKAGGQRAFMRELRAVVEAADVVLLVLDARDPLGGRCRQLEDMVARSGAHKRVVLLLNKIDLVPRDVVQRWLAYFRRELPAVAFKASTQAQRAHLARASRKSRADPNRAAAPQPLLPRGEGEEAGGAAGAEGSECFGADTLIQLLKNYCRNKDIKTAIRVGVVGLPNVGKSSVINSLKRARVAKAGATAGVTRALQEVQLDKLVRLIDSPGVVLSGGGGGGGGGQGGKDDEAAAALRNAIRPEALLDPFAPVERILQLCPRAHLNAVYGLDEAAAHKEGAGGPVDSFLRQVAQKRGRLKKGGVPDTLAAARIVLREWNEGRIPYYTLPPSPASEAVEGAEEHEEGAALVGTWGGEFGAHEVLASEQRAWQAHQGGALAPPAGGGGGGAAGHAVLPASAPATMMVTDEVEEGEEEEDEEEAEAGGMHVDDVDAVAAAEKAGVMRGREYLRQNEVLYEAAGILNPHQRRADKKRRKKQQHLEGEGAGEEGGAGSTRGKGKGGAAGKGAGGEEAEGSEGSDYDFTEQFEGMLPE